MGSLGELFVTVGAKIDGFERNMGTVSQRLSAIDRDASKAAAGFEKIGDRLTTLGGALTAGITLPLAGIGAAVVGVAGQMEQTEIAFKTMLGSAEKATAMLGELKAFAASTPFEFPDLTSAAKKMMALGFSSQEVIPVLRTVGDTASALGTGSQGIESITRALGQMRMAGRVTAEDMNQLTDAGVKGWQYLADATGKSIAEIRKMAEQGLINGAAAAQAILAGMQKDFGSAMDAQSKTLLGQWSNLKDQITFTLMDLGKVLLPIAKDMLNALQPVIASVKDLATWFSALDPTVKSAILGLTAFAAALGPVVMGLGLFISTGAQVVTAMRSISMVVGSSLLPGLTALPGMISNVATALSSNLISALTIGEKALLGVGYAAAAAAAIFAGWKLGEWAYNNIPFLKSLGDTIADLLLKIPGMTSAMEMLSGATAKQASASSDLDFATKKLEDSLKAKGVVIDKTGLSTEQYAAKLREAAKQIQTAAPATEKLSNSTGKLNLIQQDAAKAAAELKKEQERLEHVYETMREANEKARTESLKTSIQWRVLTADAADLAKRQKELEDSIVRLAVELKRQPTYIGDVRTSMNAMAFSIESAMRQADAAAGKIPLMGDAISGAAKESMTATDQFGTALERLGVKSTTEYNKIAEEAQKAYEAIAGSGIATKFEKDNAMLRMLQAQRDAMVANGQAIPKEMDAMLAKLEKSTSMSSPKVVNTFETMASQISGAISDLSRDLVQSLFEGGGSWVEKGIKSLKTIGEAVLMHFVQPATDAIAKFVSTTLADLLSGKGLGGVLDNLLNIGKVMKDVFGGGEQIASGAGTAAGAAGGAGGAAGAAASTIASTIGVWVGAIASVFGAIGTFIFGAQAAKDADVVNSHTLQIAMTLRATDEFLRGILVDIHTRLMEFREIGMKVWTADGSISLDPSIQMTLERGFDAVVSAVKDLGSGGFGGGVTPQMVAVNIDGRTVATAMIGYLEGRTGNNI